MIHRCYRYPHDRIVTIFANIGRLHMRGSFTSRFATVMTVRAIVHDIAVIEICGHPGNCCVAIITVVAAVYMRGMLTGCRGAIVARVACAYDLSMINGIGWRPDIRVMTVFANLGGLYMRKSLAGRVGAVVTARTITGDIYMIKIGRQPGNG